MARNCLKAGIKRKEREREREREVRDLFMERGMRVEEVLCNIASVV